METFKTPRQFVVKVYCLARQARAFVDAALFAPWSDLARYYEGERLRATPRK